MSSHGASPEPEPVAGPSRSSFKSFGLIDPLVEALEQMKFTAPTEIQAEALPHALQGRDIIGVASTGSGKTAAFALPILQKLWDDPKGLFACVMSPTRELAFQIGEQFEALGSAMGVRCCVITGGTPELQQSIALAKKPHIIIATPGRLQWHLENTKGFSMRSMQFLVSLISHTYASAEVRTLAHFMYSCFRCSMKRTDCLTWILVL